MKEGEASKKLVFEWKGDVLLNFCYSITLYAPDLSAPQRKEAVLAIFDDYVSLYGARMNWTTNPVSGAWKPLHGRADGYLMPGEWLMHKPEEDGYAFLFHGGEKKADASDVSFMVMARGQRDADCKDLSYLCCRFPGADVREEKVDMAGLMRRWCGLLQPLHGRGGCSAGWRYDAAMTPAIADMLSDMLKTCPGLQFDGLYHGPRCADWLIALSDPLLEKLGGLDAVTEAMRPCPVLPYEGGAVLQAGDVPGAGSDGDPESLPDYMRLGRVIEPVRAKNLRHVIAVPDPDDADEIIFPQERSDAWCTRFSGRATPRRRS